MAKDDKNKKDKKKKKDKTKSADEALHFSVVHLLEDGETLVCDCDAFEINGKTCVHVYAARLQREYGPSDLYANPEPPKGKNRNRNSKHTKKKEPLRPADHEVDQGYEMFLKESAQEGWNPFSGVSNGIGKNAKGKPVQGTSGSYFYVHGWRSLTYDPQLALVDRQISLPYTLGVKVCWNKRAGGWSARRGRLKGD
ncbi:hypothetical protein FB45DRAFT_998549 [Roridomyces roridus]|uniref:SWIM-type domain-containing protein n=1 Tax=Roridomyces roridus TaxID=1738132 RepID=A0AAD7CFF9_9AGAR|nr:hypothetical protein FB45DRAFT_998549 [Roridomyces roridus]